MLEDSNPSSCCSLLTISNLHSRSTGDEKAFYTNDVLCTANVALFDPQCRALRKTHREVAYNGYGTYRLGCTLDTGMNAWLCPKSALVPARFIVESMDEDHTSRNLAPVALASGGYVDLMNGGWDHQDGAACGGYGCLKRLATFHGTVAVNRSYDLAFGSTNPQHLRLMLPFGAGEPNRAHVSRSRVLISIFYSSPQKLEVYMDGRLVPRLEAHMPVGNQFNLSMRKPVIDDPCGSNAFAGWENKIYVLVCGGMPGVEIRTVKKIVLSLGIELDQVSPDPLLLCYHLPASPLARLLYSPVLSPPPPPPPLSPPSPSPISSPADVPSARLPFSPFFSPGRLLRPALPHPQPRLPLWHPRRPAARPQDRRRQQPPPSAGGGTSDAGRTPTLCAPCHIPLLKSRA